MAGDGFFSERIRLLLYRLRESVVHIEGGQGEAALDPGFTGLANDSEDLGLAFAIPDRMLRDTAVDIVIRTGTQPFFGWNKDPAANARSFRCHEMAFALDQVPTHKRGQVRFQKLLDQALSLAVVTLDLGDRHPVTRQHLLHFFRWQKYVAAFVKRHKTEAAVSGFDRTGVYLLVFLDIGF